MLCLHVVGRKMMLPPLIRGGGNGKMGRSLNLSQTIMTGVQQTLKCCHHSIDIYHLSLFKMSFTVCF